MKDRHTERDRKRCRELRLGHTAQSYTLALFGRRSIWGRGLKQDGAVTQDQQSPLSLPNELLVLICWLFLQIRNNNSSDLRLLAWTRSHQDTTEQVPPSPTLTEFLLKSFPGLCISFPFSPSGWKALKENTDSGSPSYQNVTPPTPLVTASNHFACSWHLQPRQGILFSLEVTFQHTVISFFIKRQCLNDSLKRVFCKQWIIPLISGFKFKSGMAVLLS